MRSVILIRAYRWLAACIAILFLLGQSTLYAHTLEFGDEHDHDGVVCDITPLFSEDQTLAPPPATLALINPVTVPITDPTPLLAFTGRSPAWAPPPRASPTIFC